MVTGSQEAEPQSFVEDVVEDVRVPRTNTFKMLRNIHRARNVFAQPSSAYLSRSRRKGGQKLMIVISANEQGTREFRLIGQGRHILLPLYQGRCHDLAAIHLCLFQW